MDSIFMGMDSTPDAATTTQNNPKPFDRTKFSKSNQLGNDKNCRCIRLPTSNLLAVDLAVVSHKKNGLYRSPNL